MRVRQKILVLKRHKERKERGYYRRRMKKRCMLWRYGFIVAYAESADWINNKEIHRMADTSGGCHSEN